MQVLQFGGGGLDMAASGNAFMQDQEHCCLPVSLAALMSCSSSTTLLMAAALLVRYSAEML
jgi:hypothetical protein